MKQIKCQSKKHAYGGCGDPRCPEGLYIKAALDQAVKHKDFSAFLTAKDKEKIKSSYVVKDFESGFVDVRFRIESEEIPSFNIRVLPTRPDYVEEIRNVDKTNIPSFETIEDLNKYIGDLYPEGVYFNINYRPSSPYSKWGKVSVNSKIDADLRDIGIGGHLRRILMKHCDENDLILYGVPTNSGDGSVPNDLLRQEQYHQKALTHRKRLVDSYLKNGYEYNYGFAPSDKVDWLTKQPYPKDEQWRERFTDEAKRFLYDTGFYIRWPKNTIPKNMLKRKPRKVS